MAGKKKKSKIVEIAENINKAITCIDTDEDLIITQIVNTSLLERQKIENKYLTLFGTLLEEDLEKELTGNFRKTVISLFKDPYEYQAEELKKGCGGIGTDETLLIEIICSKDAKEINQLRKAFKTLYNQELDTLLKSELRGDLGRILISIASGGRDENNGFDLDEVKKEAKELYEAGRGKIGTEESAFIRVLCSRSVGQLNATFATYKELYGQSFEQVISKETSGTVLLACNTIYLCATNKQLYFAKLIKKSMSGFGTKDKDLIRLLVCRSYIDLPDICKTYKSVYNKKLSDDVKSDTSGDYRKLLLALIGKDN